MVRLTEEGRKMEKKGERNSPPKGTEGAPLIKVEIR